MCNIVYDMDCFARVKLESFSLTLSDWIFNVIKQIIPTFANGENLHFFFTLTYYLSPFSSNELFIE